VRKKVGYKIILILASIDVFPLIKVSPINPHMHRLLLGGGGVFFGVRFFLGVTTAEAQPVLFLGALPGNDP
jgi:hypothetical protein